jgi:hypothetical protein
MKTTISQDADDPKSGMTLAELRAFVERTERLGLPGGAVIKGRADMRGRIRTLGVEAGE